MTKRPPQVITTLEEMSKWRRGISPSKKVGLVPTMGALHAGHATLLQKVRNRCDESVLSIFVNPTQFGPNEDLSRYPRTFEADLKVAEQQGVDIVFAPQPAEIYPENYSTFIEENILSQPLCGKFRPGHFRGVATIVFRLFQWIKPHISLFGLKDAQQFFVLDKMVRDLNLDIQVEGVQTVREPSGLALSSRNQYLSLEEKRLAPEIYRILQSTVGQLQDSAKNADLESILDQSRTLLTEKGFQLQYLEAVSLPYFIPLKKEDLASSRPYLIAVAAYLGKTRLIDNVIVGQETLLNLGIRIDGETLPV